MNFASDNTSGISDRILAAIAEANSGFVGSYGGDDLTARLDAAFGALFETEVTVVPVATGTAANVLSLAAITPPWGGILCGDLSHVMTDECGAAELVTGGAKLFGMATRNAKMRPDRLKETLGSWPGGVPHHVQPSSLSISQVSEFGAVWTPGEVAEIGAIAKTHGLKLHMDGARFANAVATLQCAPADITWRAGVDILSFGATKNGAMAAEAIVVFDPELAHSLPFRRMKTGHLLSKSRFLAAQLLAYIEDGHWLALAGHSNAMGARLAAALEQAPSARLALKPDANEVFAYLKAPLVEALKAAGATFHGWPTGYPDAADPPREDESLMRFVTSFQTAPEEIDRFAELVTAN